MPVKLIIESGVEYSVIFKSQVIEFTLKKLNLVYLKDGSIKIHESNILG